MTRLETILKTITDALHIPVMPAPARGTLPCAVYRYYPLESDGAMAKSRLEIRLLLPTAAEAERDRSREALRRTFPKEAQTA